MRNFSILFSHSGYFKDSSGPQNSPISYIKNIPLPAKKSLRVYLDVGTSDIEELDDARQFTTVLRQLQIYHMFRQFPGSHTWQDWREHLADSLTFVGEQLRLNEIAHASDDLNFDQPKNSQNH
ncbi:putative esterase [Nostoc sp. NIES-4103]|nr:putative esterase [Nostoc sp. NIES-4103]